MAHNEKPLTVRQFIEDLQKVDQDLEVYVADDCSQNLPASFNVVEPDWRMKKTRVVIY